MVVAVVRWRGDGGGASSGESSDVGCDAEDLRCGEFGGFTSIVAGSSSL